jgi:osmotically-inducible protein OsmY
MAHRSPFLLTALLATALLTACGRADEPRTGVQGQDAVVADGSTRSSEAGNGLRDAGQAVAEKAKDITITAEVKTLLARDDQLSALKIDVDTNAGRVMLQGTAPSEGARARATELSRSVDGVSDVDNRLRLQARN